MDGNGRWAQRRRKPRIYGHVRGASRVKGIVREASQAGVKALTLFAFSTENWSRPPAELDVLWKLLRKYLLSEVEELAKENVRLKIIGEVERLSPELRSAVAVAVERLSKNTGMELVFAVSYGARRELARAAQLFAQDCVEGKRRPEELSEALVDSYLWTRELGDLSDVDLVIRTSGERRISNFLLWQSAYAEYYFTETCWPDFDESCLRRAFEDFGLRDRRFGKVSGAAKAMGEAAK